MLYEPFYFILFSFAGQAICKTLEPDIAECMGVGASETMMGLVRLLFVECVAVRMEAAHGLCRLLGNWPITL